MPKWLFFGKSDSENVKKVAPCLECTIEAISLACKRKTLQILYPFLKSSNLAPECESIYLLHSNIVTNFMDKHSSWCQFRVGVCKVLIDVQSITISGTGSFEKSYSNNSASYIMTEIGIKIVGIESFSGKIIDVGNSCFQCQSLDWF